MSTFKLPKDTHDLFGSRGPGDPGSANVGLCGLGQVSALSGLYTISYKPRGWGREINPLVLSLWDGHFTEVV